MKILISILLLIFIQLTALSQTATIKVVDGETNEPLPFINICFESIETSGKSYSTSDLEGISENNCANKSIIALSYIGYKTLYDTIDAKQSKVYHLETDIFNLEQITITGTRTNKYIKDTPVITQIITSKDIEARGLTNVSDVLKEDMPGIDFQQLGYGVNIKMQGLDANYILFLIDGERMAGESGGNVDYSRLNTANIKRIEIVKGAASALYGSQAMGGVINIITKKPRKAIEFSLGSQFRQFNQNNFPDLKQTDGNFTYKQNLDKPNLNNNASLGVNIGKLSSLTSFVNKSFDAYQLFDTDSIVKRYSNIDTLIQAPKNNLPTSIDGYSDYSISQNLSYKISNQFSAVLKASYYNHNQYDFIQDNKFKKFIDLTVGGHIKYKFNNNNSIIASYNTDTYSKYDQSEKTDKRVKVYSQSFQNLRLVYGSTISKHALTTGIEYINETLLSDRFTHGEIQGKTTQTGIAFVQDDFKLSDKLNIVGGFRADHHSTFGLRVSPKISAMFKISPLTIRANYSNGFRAPNLKELYMNWDHLGMFVIKGSDNLRPETNNYYSLSGEYTKGNFNGSLTIHHSKFKNKIEGQWTDNQTVFQYINVAKFQISGAELSAKYRVIRDFNISGGYSYLHDNNIVEGVRLSTVSPHTATLRFEYKLQKGAYSADFNLSGKVYSKKRFDVIEDIRYQGNNVQAIYPVQYDAYSMWKFSITQNFYNGIKLIAGVDNILDYKASIVTFNTSTTPGRRFFIGLNASLDRLYNYRKANKK